MIRVAGIPLSVVFILIVELTERFTYYTIYGSLRSFLQTRLGYDLAMSTSIVQCFTQACYITCLLGGAMGDRFLGRFLTIGCLSSLYVIGAFMVAFSTRPENTLIKHDDPLFFIGAFVFIAIGTGGIKPVVCNFGADQIEGEDDERTRENFFSYFYWMINIGASVGVGLMATLATNPTRFGIDDGYGFFVAYLIAAFSMLGCVILFFAGSCSYIKKFLTSNTRIFRPVFSALWYSATQSRRGAIALVGWLLTIPFFTLSFIQAFQGNNGIACAAAGIAVIQLGCLIYAHIDNSFIVERGARDGVTTGDQSRLMNGQVSLQEIRQTFQTIPLLLLANTIFSFCYSLMIGPFYSQSCQMNLFQGETGGQNQINGAFFNLGDGLAIIVFIPIFEGVLYPLVERWRNRPVSSSEKLVGGFTWSALALLVAILFELLRHGENVLSPPLSVSKSSWAEDACVDTTKPWVNPSENCRQNFPCINFDATSPYSEYHNLMGTCKFGTGNDPCDLTGDVKDYCSNCASKTEYPVGTEAGPLTQNVGIYMSDFNGYWMFIPFTFIGMGEIMVNPVLYYYAYSMTPGKTQSIIQSVNLVFQGAYPAALVGVASTLLSRQQTENLNNGRLWIFYVIGLVLILIGIPVFFLVKNACVLEQPFDPETEDDIATQLSSSVVGAQLTGSWTGTVT